jgi:hypothetical protein
MLAATAAWAQGFRPWAIGTGEGEAVEDGVGACVVGKKRRGG